MATVIAEMVRWMRNVRTVLSHPILVGFAARFLLKRADRNLSSFFVAFRV